MSICWILNEKKNTFKRRYLFKRKTNHMICSFIWCLSCLSLCIDLMSFFVIYLLSLFVLKIVCHTHARSFFFFIVASYEITVDGHFVFSKLKLGGYPYNDDVSTLYDIVTKCKLPHNISSEWKTYS